MGHDPSAYLIFGINLGADDDLDEKNDWINDGVDEHLYELFKSPSDPSKPSAEYPDLRTSWSEPERTPTPAEKEVVDAYHAYWDAQNRVVKLIGVQFQITGSDGSSGNVITIAESRACADWCESIDVSDHLAKFPDTSAWRTQLLEFCDRTGLPFSEPKWLAVAQYA